MRYVPPAPSRKVAVVLLGAIAGFQVAVAAGAPLGPLAWGGSYPGPLPGNLRVASGVSAVAWGALGVVAATGRPRRGHRALLRGAAGLTGVGAVLNLASPSLPERLVWVPVTVALTVALWRASSDATSTSRAERPVGVGPAETNPEDPAARV